MVDDDAIMVAEIAHELCLNHFKIPADEWTVMACVLQRKGNQWHPLAMTTGVKCMPDAELQSLEDDLVHDLHAEVLARRALKRLWLNGCDLTGDLCLYISQAPCGEASLDHLQAEHQRQDQGQTENLDADQRVKRRKVVIRGHEEVGERGRMRTKPGRRDAPVCSSWSCTDKLTIWNALGLLGKAKGGPLLRFTHLVIGDRFHAESLRGALARSKGPVPEILPCPVKFPWAQNHPLGRTKPASLAQVWTCTGLKETLVQGKRQGSAPPKDGILPIKAQSVLSRRHLSCPIDPDYAEKKARLLARLQANNQV